MANVVHVPFVLKVQATIIVKFASRYERAANDAVPARRVPCFVERRIGFYGPASSRCRS